MHVPGEPERKRKRIHREGSSEDVLRPNKILKVDHPAVHDSPDTNMSKCELRIITDPEALGRMHSDYINGAADGQLLSPTHSDSNESLNSLFDELPLSVSASHAQFIDESLNNSRRSAVHPAKDGDISPTPSVFSDLDSLFDSVPIPSTNTSSSLTSSCASSHDISLALTPAQRTAPVIPGLFFDPALRLPDGLAAEVMDSCMRAYFDGTNANQVMLFERADQPLSSPGPEADVPRSPSGLPPFLTSLLDTLSELLFPQLPPATHALLFPAPGTQKWARQAIVNLYRPGEGISPHVDLLDRFGDGIVGVSLGGGCAMRFARVRKGGGGAEDEACAVYLPSGSVIVLSEEARYGWTHGIEKRMEDLVEDEDRRGCSWIPRGTRLSVTFRWLLPGADIVGGPATSSSSIECNAEDGS